MINTKLALVVLALCIVNVPIATAEPTATAVRDPNDVSGSPDCLYVDASQTPPAAYWAPC